jgi:hypothetical protein
MKKYISYRLIQFIILKDASANLKLIRYIYYKLIKIKIINRIISFLKFKAKNYPTKIVSTEIIGGIGNQLFQISNTLAYAWKYSLIPVFKKIKESKSMIKTRPVYWKTVFRKILVNKHLLSLQLIPIIEREFLYHEILSPTQIPNIHNKKGIILKGYFQSAKYFDNYRKLLLKYLYFISPSEKKYLKKKYSEIYHEDIISIAIHIRRGDYLKVPNVFINLAETDYYKNSIIYFQEKFGKSNYKFIVFSDDQEWSKNYVKKFFPSLKPIFPVQKDYLELYLMSCCNHQIIANSSFSWWGAYLNNYPEKIIIAPKKWFGPDGPPKHSLYMDDWIII